MKTAFFIDADFFLRRLRLVHGAESAQSAVNQLWSLCNRHLARLGRLQDESRLYRIFVYDCPPLDKKMHLPVSKRSYDLAKTPTYRFRTAFHNQLRVTRKVALRLGTINDKRVPWVLRPKPLKDMLAAKRAFADLTDDDFEIGLEQKGVDMRIGLDIASVASKRLVDQMVLVAGDSDFIPAAKTARREGIDFILDAMGAPIPIELHEHVDDLVTMIKPAKPSPPDATA